VWTEGQLLRKAPGWVYSYNLERPHYGEGMDGRPPFPVLRTLGYDLPEEFALFPPLVLDRISADWALRGGTDLLAHYIRSTRRGMLNGRVGNRCGRRVRGDGDGTTARMGPFASAAPVGTQPKGPDRPCGHTLRVRRQ